MRCVAGSLMTLALLAAPAVAWPQDSASQPADRPRIEVGAGGSCFLSGGTMPYTTGLIDTRVGVKLTERWSVEGLVHFMPEAAPDVEGFYRVQALWRVGRQRFQPFLSVGAAGEFQHYSWPDYEMRDQGGQVLWSQRAGSEFSMTPPWYPTVGIGFEKVVAAHLAIRAELTVAFAINDYGVTAALLPAFSVSLPMGHYGARR